MNQSDDQESRKTLEQLPYIITPFRNHIKIILVAHSLSIILSSEYCSIFVFPFYCRLIQQRQKSLKKFEELLYNQDYDFTKIKINISSLNDKIPECKQIDALNVEIQKVYNNHLITEDIKKTLKPIFNKIKKFWENEFDSRFHYIDLILRPPFVKVVSPRLLYLIRKIHGVKIQILFLSFIVISIFGILIPPPPPPSPSPWGKIIVKKQENESLQLFVEQNGKTTECSSGDCTIQPLEFCPKHPPLMLDIRNVNKATGTFIFKLGLDGVDSFKTNNLIGSQNNKLTNFWKVETGTFEFFVQGFPSKGSPKYLGLSDTIRFFVENTSSLNGQYEFSFYCNDPDNKAP